MGDLAVILARYGFVHPDYYLRSNVAGEPRVAVTAVGAWFRRVFR
jgi:hypothetical protein